MIRVEKRREAKRGGEERRGEEWEIRSDVEKGKD